jgi:hypothetical protein
MRKSDAQLSIVITEGIALFWVSCPDNLWVQALHSFGAAAHVRCRGLLATKESNRGSRLGAIKAPDSSTLATARASRTTRCW